MTMKSWQRVATTGVALATVLILAITSTSHQHHHQQAVIEPEINPHSFHTNSVDDTSSDLHVLTRPSTHSWRQVTDARVIERLLNPTRPHTFHWIFPSRNLDWVATQLTAVSDPNNARYGGWLSKADVDAMTLPEASVRQPVISWLIDQGLTDANWENLGTMLSITAPVSLIETMFHTEMQVYALPHRNSSESIDLKTAVIRTSGSINLPTSLMPSLAHLTGLNDFPAILNEMTHYNRTAKLQAMESSRRSRFSLRQATAPLPCEAESFVVQSAWATPNWLAIVYNYTSRQTETTPVTTTRIPAIITGQTTINGPEECFTQSDLNLIPSLIGYSATPRLAPGAAVCSGNSPTPQASSDIATLYTVVPTTTITSIRTVANGDIAAIANMILAMSDDTIPAVVVYSYSSYADTSSSVVTADAALSQLGLRGVTFIVSSGVQGASGAANADCTPEPGLTGPGSSPMSADYPASSPYVLSVGATDFLDNINGANAVPLLGTAGQGNSNSPPACRQCPNWPSGVSVKGLLCHTNLTRTVERPANTLGFFSSYFTPGGGFANYDTSADLSWQQAAKEAYFSVNCDQANSCLFPRSSFYSASRRGFPDVSAYGSFSPFALDGEMWTQNQIEPFTSAAALWAGFITRMNEISDNPMGYVNPYLYRMASNAPSTFNDIQVGDNVVTTTNYYDTQPGFPGDSSCSGWYSAPGWDPASGLGSPNLGRILDYLRANQNSAVVGDPTLTGFHGHTMQVHGTSGEYYNLISTPTFQYNAQFVFLSEGACTAELKNRTECWSHPGTYLGELGMLIGGHNSPVARIHVQAGSVSEGLSVTVYDDTQALLLEPSDGDFTHDLFTLTQPSPFTAVLTTDEFVITWHNSDQFINQQVGMQARLDNQIESFIVEQQGHFKALKQPIKRSQIGPDHDVKRQLPHGLLGQSWSERSYDNQWKWLQGQVDDYVVTDGLFGTQFLYNRFVDQSQ